jgi:hypothetical protein
VQQWPLGRIKQVESSTYTRLMGMGSVLVSPLLFAVGVASLDKGASGAPVGALFTLLGIVGFVVGIRQTVIGTEYIVNIHFVSSGTAKVVSQTFRSARERNELMSAATRLMK